MYLPNYFVNLANHTFFPYTIHHVADDSHSTQGRTSSYPNADYKCIIASKKFKLMTDEENIDYLCDL